MLKNYNIIRYLIELSTSGMEVPNAKKCIFITVNVFVGYRQWQHSFKRGVVDPEKDNSILQKIFWVAVFYLTFAVSDRSNSTLQCLDFV